MSGLSDVVGNKRCEQGIDGSEQGQDHAGSDQFWKVLGEIRDLNSQPCFGDIANPVNRLQAHRLQSFIVEQHQRQRGDQQQRQQW